MVHLGFQRWEEMAEEERSGSESGDYTSEDEGTEDYRRGGYHAVRFGDTFKSGRYVVQSKLDSKDWRSGENPLHHAIKEGRFSTVFFLLENGADPNARSKKRRTSLHYTVERGSKELIQLLISKGADINVVAVDCGTPLQMAAGMGRDVAVKFLLDCHADPNVTSHDLFSPLVESIRAESLECMELLLKALFDLENTSSELKSDLKDLYINSALQVDVSGNRKAVIIHVPYRLRKAFRKIHGRLVRELEKKFSGKDVIVVATRRIMRPPKKGSAAQRPRSRTLTFVNEAVLEDVVLPAEIVGKRIRYRLDGSKIMKVFLDPKEQNNTEYKLETFSAIYRKLSGKDVVFEFPVTKA